MSIARAATRGPTAVLLAFFVLAARPAAAQVSFGSPGDPPRVALGGGIFDILPDTKKPNADRVGLVEGEYRFGDVLWVLSPFVGVMGTGQGAFYGYLGVGFDINFPDHMVLTPSAAAGYFDHGPGIDLGYWWEFRTGAELDYRFADQRRIGIGFYHMSNAGLGRENPGEEMATLVLTVPMP
ncbi:MAG: acyloxyacyl hydrolase [Stellaceae bacterium]